MNPIRNPFSRDEYPALTDAIHGVVNGQPRPVDEDVQTPERAAEMRRKVKAADRGVDRAAAKFVKTPTRANNQAHSRAMRQHFDTAYQDAKERASKKTYGKGGKVVEDVQTPERAKEMAAKKKRAAKHSADAMKRYPDSPGTSAIVNSEIDLHMKDKRERTSKKTYGKGGVVVGEEVTPKRLEVLNRAIQAGAKGAREGMGTPAGAQARALGNRAGLAKVRAYATKGGKKVVGFAKAKREHEAAKRTHKGLQKPTNESVEVVSEDHTRAELQRMSVGQLRKLYKEYSAKSAKAGIPKGDLAHELANIRGLLRAKGGGMVVDEAVTPAQRKVFNAERERMMRALNNPNKKLSPTEREAVLARGQRSAAAEVRKDAVSPTGVKSPVHAQAKAYHEYARKESKKMDAIAKRKAVKESQELDERIIDEVDAFQAAKNWIKGQGFKTNREAAYARVQKNYDAMKKREAAAAKKKNK